MKNKNNEDYLNYLISDLGLLDDYDLYEIGITYEEYHNPTDEVLEKIEAYKDKKKEINQ